MFILLHEQGVYIYIYTYIYVIDTASETLAREKSGCQMML